LLAAPDRLQVGILTSTGLRVTDLEGGEQKAVPIDPERRRYGCTATQTRLGLRVTAWAESTSLNLLDDAGQVLCHIRPTGDVIPDVVVSPDGTRLAVQTGGEQRRIAVFDATFGKQTAICNGHREAIWAYTFSPDSARLVSVSEDRTACVWDAATG